MDIPVYLKALTSLFVIIDPIGVALIFHSLTPRDEKKHRRLMALKAIIISTLLVIIFGIYGEAFLQKLGISINAFRISGGILVFYTAFNLITKEFEYSQNATMKDISVFPMSIPMMAGPGCLTLAILLFSKHQDTAHTVSIIAAILTVNLITLIFMLTSGYIKKIIGKTGDDVLRRFLGVILAALAIQFIYDGIMQMSH